MYDFRVTPVFEEIQKCTDRIIVAQGGSACFHGKQKVFTSKGEKQIKDVRPSDMVLSYCIKTKKQVFRLVKDVFKYQNNKKTIKVKLKNGQEIIATEDHEFYFKGGWYSLKHIVSLLDGSMEKNKGL